MVRVMATGVFDLLHPGQIYYLEQAKKLGDELVVVVARDSTARKLKREPVNDEQTRLRLVSALKPVDKAVLGHEGDVYQTVKELRPDLIALGWDQRWSEAELERELRSRGLGARIVKLKKYPGLSTRRLIERIKQT